VRIATAVDGEGRSCDDAFVAADARVCPFCGEPPGRGVFCAACGRNLSGVEQLPTRRAWERECAGSARAAGMVWRPSAGDAVAAFVAAMHAAGDPGAVRMRRAEPGFLGRAQHVRGWLVRPAARGDDDPRGRNVPGLFVSVDGQLHRVDSVTQGVSYRGPVYVDVVGPEVTELVDSAQLAGELAAVLGANGLDEAPA
jgi:hypothetical protein